MRVYKELNTFNVKNPVITIGTFDGLHKGHHQVINELKKIAQQVNGETVIFTFWPHPRMVLNSQERRLNLLSTLEEKIKLFENAEIDHLIIFPFTKEFSQLSYLDFVKEILVDQIGVKHLVFGYDHQFGKNREGEHHKLEECGDKYDFKVHRIEALDVDNVHVSSTKIRVALEAGDIKKATSYLGYDYFIIGQVTSGQQVGRTIDFPTANIAVDENLKLIPGDGVYAVEVEIDGGMYKGMANIGHRPTLDDHDEKTVEVHVLDFNEDIYHKSIAVHFKKLIRKEQRFDSLAELKDQLHKDKEAVIAVLF